MHILQSLKRFLLGEGPFPHNRRQHITRQIYGKARRLKPLYLEARHFSPFPKRSQYVIVVAQERTGSTLFMELLSAHPKIMSDPHRFFLPHTWPSGYESGRRLFTRKPVRAFKFKVTNYPRKESPRDVNEFLKERQGTVTIIRLQRKIFPQSVSNAIQQDRKVAIPLHLRDSQEARNISKLRIDIDLFMKALVHYDRLTSFEDEALDDIAHLCINYGDDLQRNEDHQATANRTFEYLGLEHAPVKARTHRISKPNLSDYIENYEELMHAIEGTRFARLIHEGR